MATFSELGYSVLPCFLQADELPRFASWAGEAIASVRHVGMSRPGNDLIPLRWNDAIVAHILRSEARLHRLRDALAPRDLKWLSGYVSTKRPFSPALWWHQDWWCWDHPISFRRPAPQVALLCYLGDIHADNGALRILPGSHHASTAIHAVLPEPHADAANGLPADHAAMNDCPGQVTLELRGGDAVVLDYRLLHGTHANDTASRRDCILMSFIPAWSELPAEIKAHMIAHPALPDATDTDDQVASSYDALLPRFGGVPASLRVNRIPPPTFIMCD